MIYWEADNSQCLKLLCYYPLDFQRHVIDPLDGDLVIDMCIFRILATSSNHLLVI